MKRFTLLKTMLLLCALIVGSGSAWGEEKSYTLTFKTSGSSSDSGTAWSNTSNVSDVLTAGNDYVSSISAASNVYPARDGRGAKFGTSSKAGSITFALSSDGQVKATKVVIKGGAYITSGSAEAAAVKVNSGAAVAFNSAVTSYTEEDITYYFTTATEITSLTLAQNTAKNGRLYIVSVTVYYEEDEGEGETASWSLDPTSANVMAGESTSLQLTTNYDGTLTFTSNATSIANVSYNSSSKVITVTGVAKGSTTITVTGEATATYKAISKSISVTVSHAELESNVTDVMSGFGYSYFGLTADKGSGASAYAQPDVTSTDKSDGYDVSISWARNGSGNEKLRFDANYVRFYKGNTLTVTAPVGAYLRKIVFTEPASNKGWDGSMTASTGDYENDEKTWYATSTDVSSLVLTETTGTNRIGGMKVYFQRSNVPVSISAAKYATFCSPYKLDYSGTDVKAYMAKSTGSSVKLTEVEDGIVPANAGVVLYSETANTYNIPVTSAAGSDYDAENNELVGINVRTSVAADGGDGKTNYILSNEDAGVGFYKATTSGAYLAAHRAYLSTTGVDASRSFLGFDDETTGIETINTNRETVSGVQEYYNLNGQRVTTPTKGLYIVNGKKVIINK